MANIPAEVTHLMEEIQAKDVQLAAWREEIVKRDAVIQKFVRLNGSNIVNPKDEMYARTINDLYDKCEILQAEKLGLAEKAQIVLDRQIKRLDFGLRSLTVREEFPSDWNGPSLLSGSATGVSTPVVSAGGPLHSVSGNSGAPGSIPSIANAAQIRLAQATGAGRSGQQTPTASMARSHRESSTDAAKRRRLNTSIGTQPASSSNLRQSSLGPGTPKASTPGPAVPSRAGSAQPPRAGAVQKKIAPIPGKRLAPPGTARDRNRSRKSGTKKDRRRALARDRATPSTNASLSDSDDSASPTPSSLPRSQQDGTSDRHRPLDDDEDEDDQQLYCYCQKVSYGDMVGCDNDNCEYQWFHWGCVGLKSEPEGEWLCPTCKKLPRKDIVISKD